MVKALRDLWIIGADEFADSAGTFLMTNMRNNPETGPLHLHDFYEVAYHGGTSYDSNCLSKLRNAFVNAMVSKTRMPHTVIILFGDSTFTKDFMIVQEGVNTMINWIFTEVNRIIFHRKQQLPVKALPSYQTRVLAIGLLPTSNPRKQRKRDIFNDALAEISCAKGIKMLLCNAVQPNDPTSFDQRGIITSAGFTKFWKEISEAINIIDSRGYAAYKQLIQLSFSKGTAPVEENLPFPYNYNDHSLIITSNARNTVSGNRAVHIASRPGTGNNFHRIQDDIDYQSESVAQPWFRSQTHPRRMDSHFNSTEAEDQGNQLPSHVDISNRPTVFRGNNRGRHSHNGRGYWRRKHNKWGKNNFN